MNNTFYNLFTSSSYSLLSSNLSIEDIINFSIEQHLKYAILCDNNLAGAIEFYFSCKQKNIEPIIGLDWNYYNSHYLLIAKDDIGYHQLLKFESFTKLNKDFNPNTLTSNLIIIHLSGQPIINKNEDYYEAETLAINHACCKTADELIVLDLLDCIKHDILFENKQTDYVNSHNYLLTYQQALNYFDQATIDKTNSLISTVHWEIAKQNNKLPKFKLPKEFKTSKDYLAHCCLLGLQQKVCKDSNLINKVYIERLQHELEVIHSMGYDNYFLIVADFVNWAKNNDILIGPGRGSAAGSLVAYSMNITNIDPIKYNLIFERFLNIDRKTLPDIDIDVMDTKRQDLIDYIFDKYNPNHTSYISAYQHIKTKMAIRDIGRILDIDLKVIDNISKLIPTDSSDDVYALAKNEKLKQYIDTYPQLFKYVSLIINVPRQISTHAAGIIISDDDLWNYLPVTTGIYGWLLSEFTMDYLETLGLFKIDILGLKNLSIIDEVLNLIYQETHQKINLDNINLNDKNLFNDISNGNTIGIFQLESPGMTNTVMKIKPNSIEDISICSALFRPGPQSLIPDYVKTRNGLKTPVYLNDQIKPILEPTLGFCIYQEQVMELIKTVTNFSMSQADIFRRAISKKKEELFIKMKDEFLSAATKNSYSIEQATSIFDFILEFANYGFNHSHSLAYSYISYQMMYLKYYYPLEFFVTLLKHGDTSKNNLYITEAKKKNIKIANVDICHSQESFSIYNGEIIFGFSNIKGFGIEITKKILEIRKQYAFNDWQEIIAILYRNKISLKNLEVLVKVGAFDNFKIDRNFILVNLKEIIAKASIVINDKNVFDINLNEVYEPMSESEKETYEFQYLGYTFSNNKYEQLYNDYQQEYQLKTINFDQLDSYSNYLIQIKQLKKIMTKYNKEMCFVEFNQDDIGFNCAIFNADIIDQLSINKYYIVKLKKTNQNKMQLFEIVKAID